MRFLSEINSPADLRQLKVEDLQEVADEVRQFIIDTCSRVGGHTGASLGAVELAVAMHYVFDTPNDKLVWDVGHQAYAHKILTGRRDELHTIKQQGGLSGFLRRDESPYDTYYCITVGVWNPLLDRLRFFERTERLIRRVVPGTPQLRAEREGDLNDL